MYMVDIDFSISSSLSKDEQQNLAGVLSSYDNVFSARFNRSHMLSVSYNPDKISPSTILKYVGQRGIDAARSFY